MSSRVFLAMLLRESRGARGRLLFFTACIALGVAAVVGVAGLAGALDEGIRLHAKELLACDVAVESQRPLGEDLERLLADIDGLRRTDVRELATLVGSADGDTSTLVELKVVGGAYPFYGRLELDPPGPLAERLGPEECVVAPEVLQQLAIRRGDDVLLGGARFRVSATVQAEPDRLDFSLVLGPRVFLSDEGLARTALLGVGNRVKYRALLALPPELGSDAARVEELEERIEDLGLRAQTAVDAQPRVRRSIGRFAEFLGLVALLSLLLGGIGVAQIVRTWIAGRASGIAVLRCLGFRPRDVACLYASQVLLLAVAGSAVGAFAGSFVPYLAPRLAPDLLPPDLVPFLQPAALARGLLLGVGIALVFSLPALAAVWRVAPARVLRSDAEPLPPPRGVRFAALTVILAAVFGAAVLQGGDAWRAFVFTAGLCILGALLWAAAWLLVRTAGRLPRARLSPYLRTGVAALARPGAGTTAAIMALGLGVMVVTAMVLVERRLSDELGGALPEQAPSSFLVDIQPDQWPGVRALLEGEGAENLDSVPVVMARLASINGRSVDDIVARRGRPAPEARGDEVGEQPDSEPRGRRRSRWGLTREQRLTWLETLPASNRIVAGELWSDPDRAEVSLEEGYADRLEVELGDDLVFDVQGVPVDVTVTSLRTVEWESFAINFFLVVEPGVLEDAPHFRLAAARMDPRAEDRLQASLVRDYPNVTMVRVRAIIERVLELLGRVALGIRLLGSFTVAAGVLILAGSVSATTLRRAREAALWKTLGLTRGGVALLFTTEFALSGLLAGLLGAGGAMALAWAFLSEVVELEPGLSWWTLPIAGLAGAVLASLGGLAASARALATPPLESLR